MHIQDGTIWELISIAGLAICLIILRRKNFFVRERHDVEINYSGHKNNPTRQQVLDMMMQGMTLTYDISEKESYTAFGWTFVCAKGDKKEMKTKEHYNSIEDCCNAFCEKVGIRK